MAEPKIKARWNGEKAPAEQPEPGRPGWAGPSFYLDGVPARDLTEDDWDAMDDATRDNVLAANGPDGKPMFTVSGGKEARNEARRRLGLDEDDAPPPADPAVPTQPLVGPPPSVDEQQVAAADDSPRVGRKTEK